LILIGFAADKSHFGIQLLAVLVSHKGNELQLAASPDFDLNIQSVVILFMHKFLQPLGLNAVCPHSTAIEVIFPQDGIASSFQQFLVLVVSHFGIHLVDTVAVHFGKPSFVATALSAIKSLKQGRVDEGVTPSTHISLQFEFDTSPHRSISDAAGSVAGGATGAGEVVEVLARVGAVAGAVEPELLVESG